MADTPRRPSSPGSGAGDSSGEGFTLDTSNLRDVLTEMKRVSPALARGLRKRMRSTGDDIIAEQRSILDGPLPGNAAKSGTRLKLIRPRDGRAGYLRRVNVWKDVATKRTRSRGMRAGIKKSLKTRVVAGKSRQGVNVRAEQRVGGVMVVQWQARRFRHPVFFDGTGEKVWTDQKGQPYFWEPAVRGRDNAARKIGQAIDEALDEISD